MKNEVSRAVASHFVLLAGLSALPVASACPGDEEKADQSPPRVTVLLNGYARPIEGRTFVPGETDTGARRVAGTVVLIESGPAKIVADPGMVTDRRLILEKLAEAGVKPEEVTHVFLSHHHPDHTVNTALFPRARVVDFHGIYEGDLWEDHADRYVVAPHVYVLRTPGHTNEDASLVVETEAGNYVLTHVWWNEQMEPKIDPLAEDAEALRKSREKVLAIARWIIPGHGSMFEVKPR
jgi:glyoxylase-like metal-dependent hydrolase (beta-lactamase superfamily II)